MIRNYNEMNQIEYLSLSNKEKKQLIVKRIMERLKNGEKGKYKTIDGIKLWKFEKDENNAWYDKEYNNYHYFSNKEEGRRLFMFGQQENNITNSLFRPC